MKKIAGTIIKNGDQVRIVWADAIQNLSGWNDEDDAIEWAKTDEWLTEHMGYVIHIHERYLLLASVRSIGKEEPQYSLLFKIPKPWIVKCEKLNTK